MSKRAAILQAVKRAKSSQFKATAVKVELEANLDRGGDFYSTLACHEWIMEKLSEIGLAEQRDDWFVLAHDNGDGRETQWHPIAPLKYAEFYNDGSVDSELTFTIMLDKPENIFLLPKVIKIFKQLAKANGNGMDIRGAGMHTAWINDKQGMYPVDTRSSSIAKFENFQRSMRMLLPALYFLGTGNETSRGLSFRRPDIGLRTHRSAIDYRGGALEFRIFDTCYDNPDQILDNIVVMSRALKYWSQDFKPTGVEKITSSVKFGRDNDNTLNRFYMTYTHIELLNFGLRKLKPSYYTISQLKAQRKFKTTKRSLTKFRKEQEKAAEVEYKEYENRFDFSILAYRGQLIRDMAQRMEYNTQRPPAKEYEKVIDEQVEIQLENERRRKKSIKQYVSDRLKQLDNKCGEYTLRA